MLALAQNPQGVPVYPTGPDQAQTYGTNSQYNEQDQLAVHHGPPDTTIVSVPSEHLTPTGPNTYVNDDGESFVFPSLDPNPPMNTTGPSSNSASLRASPSPSRKLR